MSIVFLISTYIVDKQNYLKTNDNIKSTIEELIKDKKINPHKNVRLIINIDEQSTKSNGYYNLKDGLTE